MYEAEKYHGVCIKKSNEEYLDQILASCPSKLSEQGGKSSDYDKIVRCLSTEFVFVVHCLEYLLIFLSFCYPHR